MELRIILIYTPSELAQAIILLFFIGRYLVEILTKASYTITDYYHAAKCRESRLILLFHNQRFCYQILYNYHSAILAFYATWTEILTPS
jgi:hypothetical protein